MVRICWWGVGVFFVGDGGWVENLKKKVLLRVV